MLQVANSLLSEKTEMHVVGHLNLVRDELALVDNFERLMDSIVLENPLRNLTYTDLLPRKGNISHIGTVIVIFVDLEGKADRV